MSDFFDREAVSSEGSEDEEVREEILRHKSKHKRKHDESEDSDEEDDEDDEFPLIIHLDEAIANEMKDLINDDIEEEEEEDDSEDENRHGHKRAHEEFEEDLEEDDYDLIEENLGRKIKRKKKFRRVRQLEDDDEDDEDGGRNALNEREAIANELFDDDDGYAQNTTAHREPSIDRFGEIDSEHSESDEDNFIVDDNDQPIASKPKFKRGDRFTDRALQQAQDIFGVDFDYDVLEDNEDFEDEELDEEEYDGEEGIDRRQSGKKKRQRAPRKSIFELYEPAELERSHLTELDNELRNTDLPERFQLRSFPITSCDVNEIREESEWIYRNLYEMPTVTKPERSTGVRNSLAGSRPRSVVINIQQILHFIRNDLLEVPFIAYYRKEYYLPELSINDLWLIFRWDEKWCQLQARKHVNDMKKFHFEQKRLEKERKRSQRLKEKKESNNNNEEEQEFNEEQEENEDENEDKEEFELSERLNFLRLSKKKDTYTICKQFDIGKLAMKYGLTPEQFGEHLSEGYHKHEIEQHPLNPLDAAQQIVSKRFDSCEKVLQAATFMVGKQISCDPLVRKIVRQIYYERALVNVRPTKKGRKQIDEAHPCFSIKYLKAKPISSFLSEQFFQLVLAKNEGLIELEIAIDETSSSNNKSSHKHTPLCYLNEIKPLYQRDEFSKNVQNWNDERSRALDIALNRFLYPYFFKELIAKVTSEAHFNIIQKCSDKLASLISIAPYVNPALLRQSDDDKHRQMDGIRVLGLAHHPTNEEASYCSLVDEDGEIIDYLKLEHFMLKRSEGFLSQKEQDLRERDRDKLKRFILQKKPNVIALAGDTLITRDVMDDLISIVRDLHDIERFPLIPIEYVDSELSTVFMNSRKANTDFFNYPLKLRQAISLARRLQDPLNEFVQLCSADDEILCLKFHPLQDNVPREQLLNALHSEFVNRVNEVGVDINKCLSRPYLAPLIQFICGLGPRKGSYLLRTLKKQQSPLLENRTQLVQNCNIGKVVFINCAGFIKIDTNAFSDSGTDTYIEVLDSTRVHPEAYEWARKMAVDALDYDEDNDTNPAQALEEIIQKPERLRDLDLDEFAKELKRQGLGLKKQTLYDIRNELTDRYQDKRKPYLPPNDEQIFQMLTGENLSTFHVGKMIQARVTGILRRKPKPDQFDSAQPIRMDNGLWKCPFCMKNDFAELGEVWNHFDLVCPGQAYSVKVRLDNGIFGTIQLKNLSDKDVVDPVTRVKVGMTINCRILKIILERFSLDLTCRTSDLNDVNNRFKPPKDNYYDFDAEATENETEEEHKRRGTRRRTYMKRIIYHPSFHNVDFKKSEQILDESPQGEAVHDKIHQNVSIREKGKTNAFSLGKQLFIDNESFEDLDEIIARYVQPMASFARDLINFKYFRDIYGDRAAAEKMLSEEKQKAPSRIPYIISASKEFPGKFLLSYQPNQKAFHEFISVVPEGFKYRNNIFKSINALFKWFKGHFNDRSTFPRTPGPQTPINTSPYVSHQRTPQASPFVSGAVQSKSGFFPTPNINPQAIQRAAASMPNHLFNTLSQVTHQTSNFVSPNSSSIGNSFPMHGRSNVYPNQQTNSSFHLQSNGSMPPPPHPPMPIVGGSNTSRPGSRSGMEWSDIAKQDWQQSNRRGSSGILKPRTPIYATPGASSQMSISPTQEETPNITKGDQTPLVDEWC
ncbi:transcription elongation factor SPT6-like protein [Sarcoptes scabiei]|uniref:Transcription elongation factor SPT6-like protein n=1 Tax=Sarcoptes scabiei TaxID=52283 RepID=A0A132AH49_SARSC|nr:transcription elongation factor SPT6-like protein [Sarcoptes scabiei]